MQVTFIRHGLTQSNIEKRYLGRTDEELCEAGRLSLRELADKYNGEVLNKTIYTSPMKRCIETAQIIFPKAELKIVPEWSEIDFGEFEGKNYKELDGNPDYQRWIDSGGTIAFPKGESREAFISRCMEGWERIAYNNEEDIICVVHGGTILAICSTLLGGDYFDYQIKNGESITINV